MTSESQNATENSRDCPLWRKKSVGVKAWRNILKASPYLCQHIQFGIRNIPTVPFDKGEMLPAVPQTEEDRKFRLSDNESGLRDGVYEEVSRDHAIHQARKGQLISSALKYDRGDNEDRK